MQKISTTKSQGKAALALTRIKSKWGRYGIPELDAMTADENATPDTAALERIRDEWDASLNNYTEKTIKNAIANYALFDKNKTTPPTLEDLEARLAQFFEPDETPAPGDPYLQYQYAESMKKRLTTLRRWDVSLWRNAALRRFYHNGKMWSPAWENFTVTCAQIDSEIIHYLSRQIIQWDSTTNPDAAALVATLRRELSELRRIITSEKVR